MPETYAPLAGQGRHLFWHPDDSRPECRFFTPTEQRLLDESADEMLSRLMAAPFLPIELIRNRQATRVSELLRVAWDCEIYRRKYQAAGLTVAQFHHLDDLSRFPVVNKRDLLEGYPSSFPQLQAPSHASRFKTYSSGSSGLTLHVHFSLEAVITDTLMGCRQLAMQSDHQIGRNDLAAHYYTYPWWTDRVRDAWRTAFISSFHAPRDALRIITELRPGAVTGYTSLVAALAELDQPLPDSIKLVGVNSEQSTALERKELSRRFGCSVLDEFSSEELTRIAYELPDGLYYVNEDCVYLEVLDPKTLDPVPDGEWGEAVITGLLNDVMPFVRYATGDLVRRAKAPPPPWRGVTWSRIDAVGGRLIDSFVRSDGTIVPSGAVLDVMYRAIADTDAAVETYCLVQHSVREITLSLRLALYSKLTDRSNVEASVLRNLTLLLGERPALRTKEYTRYTGVGGSKRRPIQRVF